MTAKRNVPSVSVTYNRTGKTAKAKSCRAAAWHTNDRTGVKRPFGERDATASTQAWRWRRTSPHLA